MKTAISLSAIVLALGFLVYLSKDSNKMFKPLAIPPSISITNAVPNKPYLDTIVAAGLNRLNIDTLDVIIRDIPAQTKTKFEQDNSGLELEAFIDVKYYQDSSARYYIIYVGDYTRSKAIDVLSHELIHLGQYQTERLRIINNTNVLWLNEAYDLTKVQYSDRPWEIEAFDQQKDMSTHIKTILY